MKNPCIRTIVLAALLMLAALPLAASPGQESTPQPTPINGNRFEIRFMDLHAAEQLAWDQCQTKDRCQISASAFVGDSQKWVGDTTLKGFLEVRADAATQERIARALAKADAAPFTQSFQLLLLAASVRPASGGPEIPEGVKKSLADLRAFLPYKGYQLLDSSWLRATQDKMTEARIVGRDDTGYHLRMRFRTTASEDLFVDFFELGEEPGVPKPASEGAKDGQARAPRAPRGLISTSFSLKKGETIVVGTSKVDGSDDALVVLLTAVPQG